MTLLVRDAQALLRENLEFHIRQGVDFFVITDNGSTDGTAGIIDGYARAGRAERIWEPGDDFSQARWVSRMARRAAAVHGADWVINNDDDEFWRGRAGTLRDVFAQVPPDCQALRVERCNHPPMKGLAEHGFINRMVFRERVSRTIFDQPLPPKVCHRAFADVEVSQGNHSASRSGVPLAAAPTAAITISHFPIRDFASFERKIVVGGAAYARNTELDPETGATWRRLYEIWREGGLRDWYDRQVLDTGKIADALARGDLVIDDAVALTLGGSRRAA